MVYSPYRDDSKKCFTKQYLSDYLSKRNKRIGSEINELSDEEISNCDLQEWEDYLVSKYAVDPIVIFKDSIERTIERTKIKIRNGAYFQEGPE